MEVSEAGVEKFCCNDVCMYLPQRTEEGNICRGTLKIMEYSYGVLLEWNPDEAEEHHGSPEQDWTVIDTQVGYKVQNGETVELPLQPKIHPLNIDLDDLKSFKITDNSHQLVLMQKDGTTHNALLFLDDGLEKFIYALGKLLCIKQSSLDTTLYTLTDRKIDALDQSFMELNLFPGHTADMVTRFVQNLHADPYTTAMSTFSRLYNYVVQPPLRNETGRSAEEMAEVLHQSLSSLEEAEQQEVQDEGYEVVPTRVPLCNRPTLKRDAPLSIQEWKSHIDAEGRVTNVQQLKKRIFKGGLDPNLRPEVWKYLLGFFPYKATHEEREALWKQREKSYFEMKLQWKTISEDQEKRFSSFRDRKSLVEKDVTRTDRTQRFYEGPNNNNVQVLYDILMTYVMYNFDLGYVQGMSDLLSPILFVLENEVDAFWCFVGLMERMGNNFDMDQSGMKRQLSQLNSILHTVDPVFNNYLELHDSSNLYFCFRWLLIAFKREFRFQDTLRLWEVLWTDEPCPNFHLLFSLSILDSAKVIIMENKYGFTEILKHINDLSQKIDLEEHLCKAEAIYLQLSCAPFLPSVVQEILDLSLPLPLQEEKAASSNTSSPKEFLGGCNGVEDSSIEVIPDELDENKYESSLSLQYL